MKYLNIKSLNVFLPILMLALLFSVFITLSNFSFSNHDLADKQTPVRIPDWLTTKNSDSSFELQYPRTFEFSDMGEVTPSPQLYYNHWVIVRALGKEFPEHLTILIYNNVNKNLEDFARSHSFPNDSILVSNHIGSKEVLESLHEGVDGETKNYFWLDTSKNRGAIFSINPAKSENLFDLHKIIESFRFLADS